MKFINKIVLTIVLLVCLSGIIFASSGSSTDPTELGIGAKPLSLGKAYVAFSDDANTIFINPAGHAQIDGMKIATMNGQVLQDFNYVSFGIVKPYSFGTIGFGLINAGMGSIPVTTITGGDTIEVIGATDYNASVYYLSYSNYLRSFPLIGDIKNTTYGVNLKYFYQGFLGGGELLKDAYGSGLDMDLGLQYQISRPLTLGISFMNFLPETMGGKFTWVKNDVIENIPMIIKAGTKTKIYGKNDSIYKSDQDLFLGVDWDIFYGRNRPSVVHVGTEWWPTDIFAVRLGLDQKPAGLDTGPTVENNISAGLGIKAKGITFDYCYYQFGDLQENVTHFFSIGYIGISKKKPRLVQEPRVILPVVVPKPNLKGFSDVPDGYWAKGPIEFMATFGVMSGYEDGTFKPERYITRAQLAKVLVTLKEMEPNEVYSGPFPDVSSKHWAAKYIKAVSFLKYMGSYPDGTFKPSKLVTRAEGVIIISRFSGIKPLKTVSRDPYPDVRKWHWAAGAISALKIKGYLDYLQADENFSVNKSLTRAEVAEMLSKTEYGRKRIRKLLEE